MTGVLIIAILALTSIFVLFLFKKWFIWKIGLPSDVYDTLVPFLVFLSISFFLIYFGCLNGWYEKIETQFFISLALAVILGMFSLLSFFIAKRIEKRIRQSITSVAEFVKVGYEILEKPSTFYGIMVIYPYFGLVECVHNVIKPIKRGTEFQAVTDINDIIKNLANATKGGKKELCLIVLKEIERMGFLNNIKSRSDAVSSDYLPNGTGKPIKDRVQELCAEGAKIFETSLNPFNMIISDTAVVWGSVNSETPGECKGFFSYDKDVIESFKKYFEDIKKMGIQFHCC
ncbi:MAG: hypothetical protein HOO91_08600 [Bacteroidales bacterium]|nr:hypothetical protein [Bacteroidales bacterium]